MKRLLIIVMCLLLCGCYDYKELNDINIVDGIYVTYEDDKYDDTLEVVKSNKGKDGNEIKNELLNSLSNELL